MNSSCRCLSLALLASLAGFAPINAFASGPVVDEAKAAGKTPADFPETDAVYFPGLDGYIQFESDELKGLNTWMLWTAGNEAFWDYLARHSYGLTDLLKTIDSRKRGVRFSEMGLIPDPDTRKADAPDQYGLWIDKLANPAAAQPPPEVYGYASGVVGLRLFPNPRFDAAAKAAWNADRYYNDPAYYNDPNLVRPYRVGMACSFCHVSFHPEHPPGDPENPKWSELSAVIGAQYFRTSVVFGAQMPKDSFIYQLLASAHPGTVDTSLIATDGISNPNAMNPIFAVPARLARAEANPPEKMGSLSMAIPPGTAQRHVPHVLVDGADSVGIWGALNRVYVNIGEYHEQWLKLHNVLVGFKPQQPFSPSYAMENSVYWQATEKRVDNLARYFLKATPSMRLAKAPGGEAYLSKDRALLSRGRQVFAENCIGCHSSKQPKSGAELPPSEYEIWSKSQEYLTWARQEVMKPDFEENNYFSTDQRYPVTLIGTNAARALANNATKGHIWDAFSSDTYKNSPSAGSIQIYNPFTQQQEPFTLPAGGPGYYRAPTLMGIWATAPFLHNNSVGKYTGDPSVKGRMEAFNDAIEKLLWPEKRLDTPQKQKDHGHIARTHGRTYLRIDAAYLGDLAAQVTGHRSQVLLVYPLLVPSMLGLLAVGLFVAGARRRKDLLKVFAAVSVVAAVGLFAVSNKLAGNAGGLEIGPIPPGTPISLLTNLNPHADRKLLFDAILKVVETTQRIKREGLDDAAAATLMAQEVAPALLKLSNAPDFVEDRGHTFGSHLPEADKRALIEYLKTL